MNEYRVTWTIDIEAESPREAAELARAAQVLEGTSAVVFEVFQRKDLYDPTSVPELDYIDTIDLEE